MALQVEGYDGGVSFHSEVMIKFLLSCWEEKKKKKIKSINCEGSKGRAEKHPLPLPAWTNENHSHAGR